MGDEVDDADRRDATPTGTAVRRLLRARWAALERAEAAVGLVSAGHPFGVLEDADITPEEELAGEEDDDEPAPGRAPGIRVERDDRRR